MSFRSVPLSNKEMTGLLSSILDRIAKLERGGALQGEVSFGTRIVIGGVQVYVTDLGGGSKRVTFRNPDNGVVFEISL